MITKEDRARQSMEPSSPADFLSRVCVVYSGCIFPFTHKSFGVRALRPYAFCPILMFFYSGFGNCPEIIPYMVVWFAAVGYRRLTLEPRNHTRYMGYPWITGPFCKSENTARFLEALLCIGIGMLIMQTSVPLGQFVAFAGVPMLMMLAVETETRKARRWDIHDGAVEAENLMESQD